jgi:hypothetical protein
MKRACCAWSRVALGLVVLLLASAGRAEEKIQFNRDIRPILSNHCMQCHGPDARQRAAGLRLDVRDSAVAVRKGRAAIVAGKPADSVLIQRITAAEPDDRMPPPDSGKKLTPQQIELLRRWIEQGAEYQIHWAFIPPVRPAVPARQPGARNPIDDFVFARLAREGLKPASEADRITLVRRVTLDLTGLPPTLEEVERALKDESPDWYEKVVDRLLASPRYGEHMARYWLDLARYGDTHGLHFDNERYLWKYREWVIHAFNRNLPFDQFTIEQLAGDLLPNPTLEQRVATGFNRCNVTTNEGGSIDEEVLVRYAVDRTETMATVFLGLTLGCAVCHEHKFDPISQKEFYQLYAFFNSAADAAMDGNTQAPPPALKMPSPEQQARLKAIDDQLARTRQKIEQELARIDYREPASTAAPNLTEPRDFVWIDDEAPPRAQLQGNTPWQFVSGPQHPVYSGKRSMRRTGVGIMQHYFEKAEPGLKIGAGDKLFAYVYLDPKDPPRTVMLQFNDGTWEHRAFWGEDRIPWGQAGTASRLPLGPLPKAGEWVRLEVEAERVGLQPGAVLNGWAFTQFDGTVWWDRAGSVTRLSQSGENFLSLAQWEAHERSLPKSNTPPPVREAVKVPAEQRNDAQKKLIRDYFLEHVYLQSRSIFQPLHQEIAALEKEKKDVEAAIPVTMVMADLPQPRDSYLLIRGQYDKRGEKVSPGVPQVLPPMPKDAPPNRLGLARWLVDPGHPLTSRVAVNRFWQQFFGRGIVKTSEDFGTQGEWPSHPELLDWLAVEFVSGENASGGAAPWDVKRLVKRIVTSATYRQASEVRPELLQRDPENVLLARGPRFRLDAEIIRDSALFVSGLLAERIGGPSVKPYQPPGIWEPIGFNGSNTREYRRDQGEALYRRSLYTFWKRTAPPPGLMAFDAPSRETCVARRARTNTPLQALVLMNDEQYVEAARHLAERILVRPGETPAQRLALAFRLATARPPSERELAILVGQYTRHRDRYRANPEAAARLLAVGEAKRNAALDPVEHAAYTMAANLILNLDEVVTRE